MGEVDLEPTNNGVNNENNGLNNVVNNGFNNGDNNGDNNDNNGLNNDNNGEDCNGGCPGNATCEDGQCVELCDANGDCPENEACQQRFEAPGNQCVEADICVLEEHIGEAGEFCFAQMSCDETGFNLIQCAFIDDDLLSCQCIGDNESPDFEASAEVCFDVDALINLSNQNCGTRFRDFIPLPG